MTVAELIEKLKALPPDLPVQYLDYEYGETDVQTVETDVDHDALIGFPPKEKATAVWLSR